LTFALQARIALQRSRSRHSDGPWRLHTVRLGSSL
jgi:hypothetical protein